MTTRKFALGKEAGTALDELLMREGSARHQLLAHLFKTKKPITSEEAKVLLKDQAPGAIRYLLAVGYLKEL